MQQQNRLGTDGAIAPGVAAAIALGGSAACGLLVVAGVWYGLDSWAAARAELIPLASATGAALADYKKFKPDFPDGPVKPTFRGWIKPLAMDGAGERATFQAQFVRLKVGTETIVVILIARHTADPSKKHINQSEAEKLVEQSDIAYEGGTKGAILLHLVKAGVTQKPIYLELCKIRGDAILGIAIRESLLKKLATSAEAAEILSTVPDLDSKEYKDMKTVEGLVASFDRAGRAIKGPLEGISLSEAMLRRLAGENPTMRFADPKKLVKNGDSGTALVAASNPKTLLGILQARIGPEDGLLSVADIVDIREQLVEQLEKRFGTKRS